MTSIAADRRRSSSRIVRCPACGQRLGGENPVACPLCNFSFGDSRLTGDDATPYAHAYSRAAGGWQAMAVWIWLAGAERLKHIALMRASVASRRFAQFSLTLVVIGATAAFLTQVGWHTSNVFVADAEAGRAVAAGDGWHLAASLPRPLPSGFATDVGVDVWWNSLQAMLGVGIALPLAVLSCWAAMALLRAGLTRAHHANYRAEQRMTAGLHYSTAWAVPLFVGLLVMCLLPAAYAKRVTGWTWCPPYEGVAATGGVVIGFAMLMWWIWLLRLGGTAPTRTRGSVMAFLALGAPVLVAAITLGWYFGSLMLHRVLATSLRLTF